MALMPPRRSARLSEDHFSNYDQHHTNDRNKVKGNTSGLSSHNGGASSSTVLGTTGSSRTTIQELQRKERRWEDINESDDEVRKDDENDSINFMSGFDRPVITGNVKHAASIPIQRQARTTFHEQEDDDGFIFSSVDPAGTSKGKEKATMISGSKGAPPRRSVLRSGAIEGDGDRQQNRISSGPVKAVRRVSLLRDGTAAVPHPIIADTDLHRHCSSDLDPRQRLQHLAVWTLDRSYAKIMKTYSAPSSSRQTLDHVVQRTIESLTQNTVLLDWDGRRKIGEKSGKSKDEGIKALRPHHRNEANRKTETQLRKRIEVMENEMKAWKEAEKEIESIEDQIRSLESTLANVIDPKSESNQLNDYLFSQDADENDQEFENVAQLIRKAFSNAAIWLQSDPAKSDTSLRPTQEEFVRLSNDLFNFQNGDSVPPKPVKRRRTTSTRDYLDSDHDKTSSSISSHLQGSESDPRWNDIEWNVDLLHSRAHSYSQLARLADRYTTAVSARGAQAIGELIGSEDRAGNLHGGIGGVATEGKRVGEGGNSSFSSNKSKISREGQQTLQRILSGIRKIESGIHTTDEDEDDGTTDNHARRATQMASESTKPSQAAAGDISDGDILRAFAGISRR